MGKGDKDIEQRIQAASDEAKEMKKQIKDNLEAKADTTLATFTKNTAKLDKCSMKCRRTLRGHLSKIYALQWAEEKTHLVSASQDGRLLVWDALTTNETHAVPLRCSWVMTCAYSPSGNFVACGGLDNVCSVFRLDKETITKPTKELDNHTGYLSCCRFLSDRQILTSSPDKDTFVSSGCDNDCILWSLSSGKAEQVF